MSSFIFSFNPNREYNDRNRNDFSSIFVVIFMAIFLVIAALYWVSRFYFVSTGDLLPMRSAAKSLLQRPEGCLYRNIVSSHTHYLFKRELFLMQEKTPEVIVLGSSRVLLFHKKMFTRSFINMGRAGNYLQDALSILKIFASSKKGYPKVLLIGVDFWWFHPRLARRLGGTVVPRDVSPESLSDIIQLLRRSMEHPAYVLQAWRHTSCNIGVDAILNDRGFDRFGFLYTGYVPAAKKRIGFTKLLERIEHPDKRFDMKNADEEMLREFINIVKKLERKGVRVILFMPPFPSRVIRSMKRRPSYINLEHLKDALASSGLIIFDFNDHPYVFNDCQFVDGMHQGDSVNAAILLAMSEKVPILREYIDIHFLKWLSSLESNALVLNSLRLNRKEEDFLGIGCIKADVHLPNKD